MISFSIDNKASKVELAEDAESGRLLKQGEPGHPGTPLPFMMRMAVLYRSENKKIIRSQINLIQKIIKVLRSAETALLGRTEPGKDAQEEKTKATT